MFVVVPLNCCRCCYGVMVVQAKSNIPKTKKELDGYSIEPLEHLRRFHYVSAYYSFFFFFFLSVCLLKKYIKKTLKNVFASREVCVFYGVSTLFSLSISGREHTLSFLIDRTVEELARLNVYFCSRCKWQSCCLNVSLCSLRKLQALNDCHLHCEQMTQSDKIFVRPCPCVHGGGDGYVVCVLVFTAGVTVMLAVSLCSRWRWHLCCLCPCVHGGGDSYVVCVLVFTVGWQSRCLCPCVHDGGDCYVVFVLVFTVEVTITLSVSLCSRLRWLSCCLMLSVCSPWMWQSCCLCICVHGRGDSNNVWLCPCVHLCSQWRRLCSQWRWELCRLCLCVHSGGESRVACVPVFTVEMRVV